LGATQFVTATAADYAGSERLLRGVFGYQPLATRPGQVAPDSAAIPQGISIKADKR
jgi:hypothetical protein